MRFKRASRVLLGNGEAVVAPTMEICVALYCRRVIDGDTIQVARFGTREPLVTIRLVGVDTPETWGVRLPEAFGPSATEFTAAAVGGQVLVAAVQPQAKLDKYQRTLAYVHVLGSDESLNAALLKAGLAVADFRFAHPAMEAYHLLEREAAIAGLGLWSVHPPPVPGWRRARPLPLQGPD